MARKLPTNRIVFKSDTAERKKYFTANSFSHPAKMVLGLQIYLIERYTKPGDTILDPMAGSGTILIATHWGRNVILVELEEKFINMQKKNWARIQSVGPMLGCTMGQATILQGDARTLDGLLADGILFSPPYAEAQEGGGLCKKPPKSQLTPGRRERWKQQGYQQKDDNPANISNLPYGAIDAVISSPPYGLGEGLGHGEKTKSKLRKEKYRSTTYTDKVDAVITSPPYEQTISGQERRQSEKFIGRKSGKDKWGDYLRLGDSQLHIYSDNDTNIGNLKSENYLQAMAQVYNQCQKVLKPEGLLILVTKNFIRDKKIIRLNTDTIKLCEKAGFKLKERLERRLISMSFWRIIYHQKYPAVEKIEHEDVLIFAIGT